MKIPLKDLRFIYDLIEKKLTLHAPEEIEISSDYYWHITSDERENLQKEPNLCVGSLDDDWAELKKVLISEHVTLVDIDRFANILIAIGEKISK